MNKRALSSVLAASVLMSQLPMGILAAQAGDAVRYGLNAYTQDGSYVNAYDTVYDALADARVWSVGINADTYKLHSDAVIGKDQTVYVYDSGTLNVVPEVYTKEKDASAQYDLLTKSQGHLNVYAGATLQENGKEWIGKKGGMTLTNGDVNFKFNGSNDVAMTVGGNATADGFIDTLLGQPLTMTIGEGGYLTMPEKATMNIYGEFDAHTGGFTMKDGSNLQINDNGAVWLAENSENIGGQITVWSQNGSFKYGKTLIFGTDKWTQTYAVDTGALFVLGENSNASFAPASGELKVNVGTITATGEAMPDAIQTIVIPQGATLVVPQDVILDLGAVDVQVDGIMDNQGKVTGSGTITVGENGTLNGKDQIDGPEITEPTDPKPEPDIRNVTFNANGGIITKNNAETYTISWDTTTAEKGNQLPCAAPVAEQDGYKFDGWFTKANGGEEYGKDIASVDTYKFTTDTIVYAQWTKNSSGGGSGGSGGGGGSSSTTYAVNIGTFENGSVKANPSRAAKGAVVSLTVTPDKGYELDTLTVTDKDGDTVRLSTSGNNVYTFTMPASQVTVKATFKEASTLPFSDVSTSDWFYSYVKYVYENGLMSGVSDTSFAPNATTTRGMIVTTLYSMAGKPAAADQGFNDVTAGQWYTDAVNWAAANKIVTGYPNGGFGPNDTITREQLAVMLYGYAQSKGYDVSASKDLTGYADASQVSSYAMPAMQWAFANGLISGTSNTTLSPAGAATRAQVATILTAFSQNIVK